jgi:hypothetical protein
LDPLTTAERAGLLQLRKEAAELRRANESLKAAPVFFAEELDQPRPGAIWGPVQDGWTAGAHTRCYVPLRFDDCELARWALAAASAAVLPAVPVPPHVAPSNRPYPYEKGRPTPATAPPWTGTRLPLASIWRQGPAPGMSCGATTPPARPAPHRTPMTSSPAACWSSRSSRNWRTSGRASVASRWKEGTDHSAAQGTTPLGRQIYGDLSPTWGRGASHPGQEHEGPQRYGQVVCPDDVRQPETRPPAE